MKKTKTLFQQLHEANEKIKELKNENELLSNRLIGFKEHYMIDEMKNELVMLWHLCEIMSDDLIEASEFLSESYESLAEYKNYEQIKGAAGKNYTNGY
jgi:uncharacterized radical SAM superfamily protein